MTVNLFELVRILMDVNGDIFKKAKITCGSSWLFLTHMHWLHLFFIAMGIADNTNKNKRLKFNMIVKQVVLKIILGVCCFLKIILGDGRL